MRLNMNFPEALPSGPIDEEPGTNNISVPIMKKRARAEPETPGQRLGRDLKQFAEAHGLIQERVAELMGQKQGSISRLMNGGTKTPEAETIVAASALMGVDPAQYMPDAPKAKARRASSALTPTKSPFVSRQEFESLQNGFAAFVEILGVVVGATVAADRSLPSHTREATLKRLAELQEPGHSQKKKSK